MKCPNCENSIEDNSISCEWCGINLQEFEAEQKAEAERLAKEKAEATRKVKEAEETLRKAKEQETALNKQKQKEAALQKAKDDENRKSEETTFVKAEDVKISDGRKTNNEKQEISNSQKQKIILWSLGVIVGIIGLGYYYYISYYSFFGLLDFMAGLCGTSLIIFSLTKIFNKKITWIMSTILGVIFIYSFVLQINSPYIKYEGNLSFSHCGGYIHKFHNDNEKVLLVKKNNKWGFAERNGILLREITPQIYDLPRDGDWRHYFHCKGKFIILQYNGKFGCCRNGNIIIPFQYDYMDFVDQDDENTKFIVSLDGESFYINQKGERTE